ELVFLALDMIALGEHHVDDARADRDVLLAQTVIGSNLRIVDERGGASLHLLAGLPHDVDEHGVADLVLNTRMLDAPLALLDLAANGGSLVLAVVDDLVGRLLEGEIE